MIGHAERNRVWDILRHHQGRAMAITAPEIAQAMGWATGSERRVRLIIEANGNSEWPGVLCAAPGTGYFLAETMDEIVAYRDLLISLQVAAKHKLGRFNAAAARAGFHLEGARQ